MLSIQSPPKKEEGIQNLQYYKILESSFIYYIVGKPGSGKTHLIQQMMSRSDIYKDKFNKIILVSPQQLIPCTDYLSSLDLRNLWSLFKINDNNKNNNILIIFDDVISQIHDLKHDVNFQNLIFNRRNIIPNTTISIIITSQKYILLPPNIRSCITMLYFFQMFGNDLQRIKNEWIKSKEDKEKLEEALQRQKLFDFISIRSQPYEIRLSFELIQNLNEIQSNLKEEKPIKQLIETKFEPKYEQKENKKIITFFAEKSTNTQKELPVIQNKKLSLPKYQNSLYNML